MKKLVIVLDGLSENRVHSSMALAKTPNLDYLVSHSNLYQSEFVPENLSVGSDVANMCILGYDPTLYYTGRAYIESVAANIDSTNKKIYRLNLVQSKDNEIIDFTGKIENNQQAQQIINKLKPLNLDIKFIDAYHHLLLSDKKLISMPPPHEITNENYQKYLKQDLQLQEIVEQSKEILKDEKSNMVWIWGYSTPVKLPTFKSINQLSATMISATPLLHGLAKLMDIPLTKVENIDGTDHSNIKGKIEQGLNALNEYDYVFIHIEALDYLSHKGAEKDKIKCLEQIDSYLNTIKDLNNTEVLILSDHHASPISKVHERGLVPVVHYQGSTKKLNNKKYNEQQFKDTKIVDGLCLAQRFIKGEL